MINKRMLVRCGLIGVVISLPFTVLHLIANPDDAPISPLQHVVAALANYFGPWGVVIVRVVDFPNAGLRAFSLGLALALTALGALLILWSARESRRWIQHLLAGGWVLFAIAWFLVGFFQIASGLL
jgi:hypothetical protein